MNPKLQSTRKNAKSLNKLMLVWSRNVLNFRKETINLIKWNCIAKRWKENCFMLRVSTKNYSRTDHLFSKSANNVRASKDGGLLKITNHNCKKLIGTKFINRFQTSFRLKSNNLPKKSDSFQCLNSWKLKYKLSLKSSSISLQYLV